MFFSLCRDFGRAVLLFNYSIQEKSGNCKCLLVIMTYVVCKKVPCCRGDDLQSAYILCYFIRNRRWALIVCSGFTSGEYHVIRVDFIFSSRGSIRNLRFAYIVCVVFLNEEYRIALVDFIGSLRGHQRTKEKDSAEPLSSILWTPPPHPGESAAAGHYCCRGLGAI